MLSVAQGFLTFGDHGLILGNILLICSILRIDVYKCEKILKSKNLIKFTCVNPFFL